METLLRDIRHALRCALRQPSALLGPPDDGETAGKTVFGVGTGVSPEHFDFFGVRFPLGRGFLPEEHRPDGPRVAVIDHTYWRRHLGADPAILGRTLRVNGVAFTVVGVLPRGFENTGLPLQVYVPMPRIDELIPTPKLEDRGRRGMAPSRALRPRRGRELRLPDEEIETTDDRFVVVGLARLLTSLLYGVAPHDPATFLALPPLLAAVGLAAAWLPARRAGRVDPKIALQEE